MYPYNCTQISEYSTTYRFLYIVQGKAFAQASHGHVYAGTENIISNWIIATCENTRAFLSLYCDKTRETVQTTRVNLITI